MRLLNFIRSIRQRDEAKPTFMEVVLAYPGFHSMVIFHPIAHFLWQIGLRALARFWAYVGRFVTGIEIHPAAKIGKNLFIDHGTGVVIGQTAIIGDDCLLYQGVTLGGKAVVIEGRRHPILGNGVTVGAGTQVLGPITIGDNAKIGANSLVTMNVPPGVTAVGSPARLVGKIESPHSAYGLPDGDMPDPVETKLKELEKQLEAIRSSVQKGKMQ